MMTESSIILPTYWIIVFSFPIVFSIFVMHKTDNFWYGIFVYVVLQVILCTLVNLIYS